MPSDNQNESDAASTHRVTLNRSYALLGGSLSALVMASIAITVGAVSGTEAQHLLEAIRPPARFLGSSTVTASATTLALMLTLLGLSANVSAQLKDTHYLRIRQIALVDCIAFILAIILLLTLVIPFRDAEQIHAGWYSAVYYFLIALSSSLGGIMVAVILMIYSTVRDMTDVFVTGAESPLVAEEPDSDRT